MASCRDRHDYPPTFGVDAATAVATLDFVEMVALSQMFERWAFTEEEVSGERRTWMIEAAADYRDLALWCGIGWRATAPESHMSLIPFVAQLEARAHGLYDEERELLAGID